MNIGEKSYVIVCKEALCSYALVETMFMGNSPKTTFEGYGKILRKRTSNKVLTLNNVCI